MNKQNKQLSHFQKLQLEKVKYLNDSIKAKQELVSNLAFRKKLLDYQKRKNYSSEYERIRSHLADKSLSFQTQQNLIDRTNHLKKLGATAYEIA